jgi:alpha,alpha-trehalose phosphorylase
MKDIYKKKNAWILSENKLSIDDYQKNESLMTLSNGYLSMRGSFEEENIDCGHDGTYLNGLYEFYNIHYSEKFPGYPDKSQVMINLPDPKSVVLTINDEIFSLNEGNVISFYRELNLKEGVLQRKILWESPLKDRVEIESTRFVSAVNPHLAGLLYGVTAKNFSGSFSIGSMIVLDRKNLTQKDDPRVGIPFQGRTYEVTKVDVTEDVLHVKGSTKKSNLKFTCSIAHSFSSEHSYHTKIEQTDRRVTLCYHGNIDQGETISLTKYIWYDRDETDHAAARIQAIKELGFSELLKKHTAWWEESWKTMDIIVDGETSLQQAIRFNLFHLTQAVGRNEFTNIGAKALTGEGYEGHYFWDTEIYMLPFFLYTKPEAARRLLMYRYHTLDQARRRAKDLGHKKGALFPWRTINGDECSSYFPAGTAHYHINADIAYAIYQYYRVTCDRAFMERFGLEMLIELSDLWMEVGLFDDEKEGAFCIHEVTGPDEYSCLVNNNMYTNAMVKHQMAFTIECIESDLNVNPKIKPLVNSFDLKTAERIVKRIYLPYNKRLKIYGQDDSFLSKPVWNIKTTPKEHFPLLMHYHPLTLYRYQVCKQADVVLTQVLLPKSFTFEQKKRNFGYYEKITTHDSSLSYSIYGIMACELGNVEQSYDYYLKTARTDLDDIHYNVKDGVHIANMAGSWMGIIYGFAGMRMVDGTMTFSPALPKKWAGYQFSICVAGNKFRVSVNQSNVTYELIDGEEFEFFHHNERLKLVKNTCLVKKPGPDTS